MDRGEAAGRDDEETRKPFGGLWLYSAFVFAIRAGNTFGNLGAVLPELA
jgi:hypothetical protein